MKLLLPLLMVAVTGLGACAATPGTPDEMPAAVAGETRYETMTAAAAAADDDDLICRKEEVLGSRFRQKVCKTRTQREMEARQSKEEFGRATSRGAPINSR